MAGSVSSLSSSSSSRLESYPQASSSRPPQMLTQGVQTSLIQHCGGRHTLILTLSDSARSIPRETLSSDLEQFFDLLLEQNILVDEIVGHGHICTLARSILSSKTAPSSSFSSEPVSVSRHLLQQVLPAATLSRTYRSETRSSEAKPTRKTLPITNISLGSSSTHFRTLRPSTSQPVDTSPIDDQIEVLQKLKQEAEEERDKKISALKAERDRKLRELDQKYPQGEEESEITASTSFASSSSSPSSSSLRSITSLLDGATSNDAPLVTRDESRTRPTQFLGDAGVAGISAPGLHNLEEQVGEITCGWVADDWEKRGEEGWGKLPYCADNTHTITNDPHTLRQGSEVREAKKAVKGFYAREARKIEEKFIEEKEEYAPEKINREFEKKLSELEGQYDNLLDPICDRIKDLIEEKINDPNFLKKIKRVHDSLDPQSSSRINNGKTKVLFRKNGRTYSDRIDRDTWSDNHHGFWDFELLLRIVHSDRGDRGFGNADDFLADFCIKILKDFPNMDSIREDAVYAIPVCLRDCAEAATAIYFKGKDLPKILKIAEEFAPIKTLQDEYDQINSDYARDKKALRREREVTINGPERRRIKNHLENQSERDRRLRRINRPKGGKIEPSHSATARLASTGIAGISANVEALVDIDDDIADIQLIKTTAKERLEDATEEAKTAEGDGLEALLKEIGDLNQTIKDADDDIEYLEGVRQSICRDEINQQFDSAKQTILTQHQLLNLSFGHIETLCQHFGSKGGAEAAKAAQLSGQFICNLRILRKAYDSYHQHKANGETGLAALKQIGSALAIAEPVLGCAALAASLYSLLTVDDKEALPPLTQQAFFDVVNDQLFPMLEEIHTTLNKGQRTLGEKIDAQTSLQILALDHVHKSLSQQLKEHTNSLHARFDSAEFNAFKTRVKGQIETFDDERVKCLSTGGNYLKHTQRFLKQARSEFRNGLTGNQGDFALKEAWAQPAYATGVVARKLDREIPPLSPHIDVAAYHFLSYVNKLMSNLSEFSQTIQGPEFGKTLRNLQAGIAEQKALFSQTAQVLNRVASHFNAFKRAIQEKQSTTQKEIAQKNAVEASRIFEAQEKQMPTRLVGRHSLFWSELVNQRTNLPYLASRISAKMTDYEIGQLAFSFNLFSLIAAANYKGKMNVDSLDPSIRSASLHVENNSVKQIVESRGRVSFPIDSSLYKHSFISGPYQNLQVRRVVWYNESTNSFTSNVFYNTMSLVPYRGYFKLNEFAEEDSASHGPARSMPSSTMVALETTLTPVQGKWEVKTDASSHLKIEDIEGIPAGSSTYASHRAVLMRDMSDAIRSKLIGSENFDANPVAQEVRQAALCLPLDTENLPLLPIPQNNVEHLLQAYAPQRNEIQLSGADVTYRYSFRKMEDGFYHFKIHLCYENAEGKCSFRPITRLRVSAATVEAFRKPSRIQTPEDVHLAEFFACLLFGGYYPNEGMPNKSTYVSRNKDIVAPDFTPLPPVSEILRAFPQATFVYDHRVYDDSARAALEETLRSQKITPASAHFFELPALEIDPAEYMKIQDDISKAVDAAFEFPEYKAFKSSHELAITQMCLASSLTGAEIQRELASHARIISPGQMGLFAGAPVTRVPVRGLRTMQRLIEQNPSLEMKRFNIYKQELKNIEMLLTQAEISPKAVEDALIDLEMALGTLKEISFVL
ncbi:MAG: hypothetical protein K2P51_00515 [Rhabdochlamydiaceae bacterium]|nr:hypothetical protein [Rhabdochlamydiaceae bacterium]